MTIKFDNVFVDKCANDSAGPVALTLKQKLLSVEGSDAVIFPPTYAFQDKRTGPAYNLDTLSDGTKVAMIDSVGAQANRMEPLFEATTAGAPENPLASLVPQIVITYGDGESVSIFQAGHRLGDALIRSTELADKVQQAFRTYLNTGNASVIAKMAPTSLVFGVWDSRDTGAKLPRIVQSVIRAWDIDTLTRSAQYNPPIDYSQLDVFSKETKEKAEGRQGSDLAKRGFVHVPAAGTDGGIVVHGEIRRDITINLVALRRLAGENEMALRRYILSLALVAATAPLDGFLRQGCLVTPDPDAPSIWTSVGRDGVRVAIDLEATVALALAQDSVSEFFGPEGMEHRTVKFDKKLAAADAKKK